MSQANKRIIRVRRTVTAGALLAVAGQAGAHHGPDDAGSGLERIIEVSWHYLVAHPSWSLAAMAAAGLLAAAWWRERRP